MSERVGLLQTVGDNGSHRMRGQPVGSALDWSLTISGAVERPCTLSLATLWTLPVTQQDVDITCVSSGKIYRPKGQQAHFVGISLYDIFEHVGLLQQRDGTPVAQSVRFISRAPGACGPLDRPHETSLSLDVCLDDPERVLLAGMLDGQPLPYPNGGPLRSVVQEYFFYKSVKWLSRIELSEAPLSENKGTWERFAGYHNVGRVGGDRFSPFIQCAHTTGADGDELRYSADDPIDDAVGKMKQLFLERLAAGDISGLTVARLQEFVPDFAEQPGWDRSLRWQHKAASSASTADHEPATPSTHGLPAAAALRGTRFNQLDMRGWELSHVNFSLATFIGTRLANDDGTDAASMRHCDFEGARFWGAKLQGVDMRGAYLGGVSFVKDPATNSGAADVEGLQLHGAGGLDQATADWLRDRGALGAEASAAAASKEEGGYLPCHALTIACSLSQVRPLLQRLQELLSADAPTITATQGQPLIYSRNAPHSCQLQAWLPAHRRIKLQARLLPALQRLPLDGPPPVIAIAPEITWIWRPREAVTEE